MEIIVIKSMKNRLRAGALGFVLLGMAFAAPPASGAAYFHSPSGNIGCGLAAYGARCDIANHSWKAPPKPKSCRGDWGHGLTIGKSDKGRFFCASDSVLGIGNALAYGKVIKRGNFKCVSREDGIRCVNTRTKHGFKISIEHANRF